MSNNSEFVMPFSTALYKCYVDEEICDQIIEWINAKSGTDHMAAFNLVGQISGEYVIDIGTFPKLETAIKSNMATYIMSLIDTGRKGSITGFDIKYMWANRMEKYDWNPPHVHSYQFSGVLYLNDWDPIQRNPHPNKAQGGVTVFTDGRMTNWNNHEYRVVPKKGLMVLFPAWLSHGVGPSWNDDTRYSVSWNI
jgi:hypothetical protein